MASKQRKKRLRAIAKHDDINTFLEEFQNESDRATAILGAAILDESLRQLITAFLVDDPNEVDQLLESEKPLGSFGARIRAAYCLGFLPLQFLEGLKTIKNIRNTFAHELHGLSFADEEVTKECNKLQNMKLFEITKSSNSKQTFILATLFIWMHLGLEKLQIGESRRRLPKPPTIGPILSV